MKKTNIAAFAVGTVLAAGSANAATILESWTTVETLDYTGVVGAWNFVESDSTAFPAPRTNLVVQGVTFTTVDAGNGTYGNLTVGGLLAANSGFTASQTITGGAGSDGANLTTIASTVMNGQQGTSASNDITLDVSGLANGTYKIQYLFAASGASDRSFAVSAEGTTLDTFVRTSNSTFNYLLTDTVAVTDGTLNIRAIAPAVAAGDNRRLISSLVVSIPEPASALLGGLGFLFLLRRRR